MHEQPPAEQNPEGVAAASAPRHLAIIRFDQVLLLELLGLPRATKIESARVNFEHLGDIEFRVEHPDLKPVVSGHAVPRAFPHLQRRHSIEFVNWGQEEPGASA